MGKFVDLTGQRFDRWQVVGRDGHLGKGIAWLCVCDCGSQRRVRGSDLTYGNSTSCGCKSVEATVKRSTKHGLAKRGDRQRSYGIWKDARKRCYNPNHKNFADYGGRGITMCPEWDDYEVFLFDMGEPPTASHTIDRIDNSKGYNPANCRWVSIKDQQRNKRNNVFVEYQGQTKCVGEWAEIAGINISTLRDRMLRGWDFQKAMQTPVMKRI